MEASSINRNKILQSTLFHIQLKQLQYIDDFPATVTDIFIKYINDDRIDEFDMIKSRLYRIKSSFFTINKDKISKREFFEGLFNRIQKIIR